VQVPKGVGCPECSCSEESHKETGKPPVGDEAKEFHWLKTTGVEKHVNLGRE
jgi:hypothetical protein